jgi:enoyl-CoA hydratase/carnithine racemase
MAEWRLPRFVGLGRAMRLAISGEQIGADEALRMGLVDYVCPKEGFEQAARAIIDRYAAVPPEAAGAAKRMMRRAFERDYASVFAESRALLEERRASPEVLAAAEAWERRRAARGTDGD